MVISEPAGLEGKQPAGNGESGDGDVAESERPPRARLLPALTLPRFPCTPIPAAHTANPKIGILPPCAAARIPEVNGLLRTHMLYSLKFISLNLTGSNSQKM